LRESVVALPAVLAKRVPKIERNGSKSVIDQQTQVQPRVLILEGTRGENQEKSLKMLP